MYQISIINDVAVKLTQFVSKVNGLTQFLNLFVKLNLKINIPFIRILLQYQPVITFYQIS